MKTHWFPLIRPAIKPLFLGARNVRRIASSLDANSSISVVRVVRATGVATSRKMERAVAVEALVGGGVPPGGTVPCNSKGHY